MSSTQTATASTHKVPLPPSNSTPKKLKHKGSKPIFNWLTKKLVGGGPRHHAQRPEEPPRYLPFLRSLRGSLPEDAPCLS
jgi:hypothetical protein